MGDRYLVPKATVRVETRAGNSRFVSTIGRADSPKEAHAFLRAIREEMPDATHHVYAFIAGYGASVSEGLSDDGEPSGTSGPPAMAVLRGADIGDVVLVVTRYFGGTKLGTGGLVQAYTAAAKAALEALETEERVERIERSIALPYSLRETIVRLLPDFETDVLSESFEADVKLVVSLPEEHLDALTKALADASSGKVAPRPSDDA